MSYTAWPGSLADRVIQWFRINREEELLTGDLAIRYLERNKDRSFFLHLHFDGSHWPYTPPPTYLAKVPETAPHNMLGADPKQKRNGGDPQLKAYLGWLISRHLVAPHARPAARGKVAKQKR